VFEIDRRQRRRTDPDDKGDLIFLKRILDQQLLTFTWWVNRKDAQGKNFISGRISWDWTTSPHFDRRCYCLMGGQRSQIRRETAPGWMAMFAAEPDEEYRWSWRNTTEFIGVLANQVLRGMFSISRKQ
jgi:hypothetical protein